VECRRAHLANDTSRQRDSVNCIVAATSCKQSNAGLDRKAVGLTGELRKCRDSPVWTHLLDLRLRVRGDVEFISVEHDVGDERHSAGDQCSLAVLRLEGKYISGALSNDELTSVLSPTLR